MDNLPHKNLLTDAERQLGIKYHVGVAALKLRRCVKCNRPLPSKNKTGIHVGCKESKAAITADPDEVKEHHEPLYSQKDSKPSTIEATRIDFQKRILCQHCGCDQFHLTCPSCWPLNVVAVSCFKCGTVVGYFDEMISATILELDEAHEMPARESSIMRGIYRPNMHEEQKKLLVIEGLKLGVEIEQIAEDLDVTPEFVHAVGVNTGMLRDALLYGQRKQQVLNLWRKGKTDKEIAAELRITIHNARVTRKRQGLGANKPWTKVDEIRKRYLSGERNCDIMRALNVRHEYVSKAIRPLKKFNPSK
jgi:hypothetical protein